MYISYIKGVSLLRLYKIRETWSPTYGKNDEEYDIYGKSIKNNLDFRIFFQAAVSESFQAGSKKLK